MGAIRIPKIDKRKAIVSQLSEACDIMPGYSFAEILYSALRKVKPKGTSVGWILEVKDSSIFSAVDSIIEEEIEIKEDGKKR